MASPAEDLAAVELADEETHRELYDLLTEAASERPTNEAREEEAA